MEEHFFGQVAQKAILKYKDSFVLVKQDDEDNWILPGGRLNIGETPESGLLREIKEELSVDATVEQLVSVDAYHGGGTSTKPKFFLFYLVSVDSSQEIVINNEITAIVLISKKEELEKFPMYQNQKEALEKFLK